MRSELEALCACLLPAAGGMAGGACINRALDSDWYRRLRKPALRPPAWLFGPVWTALYTAMGYASYLVWRDGAGFHGNAVTRHGAVECAESRRERRRTDVGWRQCVFRVLGSEMHVSCPAVIACAVPFGVPALQAAAFRTLMRSDWYDRLRKPRWTPPRWAYAPVWSALYAAMGYASYLVWRDGAGFPGPARLPLVLYGSQLVLNWLWGPIFFGARSIPWSLVDITLLWANVAACGYSFYGINAVAGYLFVPYFLWVTLATALNYQIYKLNCTDKGSKD
ncbi:translocator protein-like [Schistocerca cancellata]|uniref:translocator protein-like n=1 Tax=Schistocerca cancellata TaxID=274614 RepID=UPI002118043D|nr:translocator protein-like [Schistocerca cancellata]